MENDSLILNEEGQICRKEIVVTPLDENQLEVARNEYNNLVNQREEVIVRLNQLHGLIGEFNGVFDKIESDEASNESESESE